MKSITTTYPGFHALPKGIKQMLLVSESLFFDEARPLPKQRDQNTRQDPNAFITVVDQPTVATLPGGSAHHSLTTGIPLNLQLQLTPKTYAY